MRNRRLLAPQERRGETAAHAGLPDLAVDGKARLQLLRQVVDPFHAVREGAQRGGKILRADRVGRILDLSGKRVEVQGIRAFDAHHGHEIERQDGSRDLGHAQKTSRSSKVPETTRVMRRRASTRRPGGISASASACRKALATSVFMNARSS